jgi:hypothetical protein
MQERNKTGADREHGEWVYKVRLLYFRFIYLFLTPNVQEVGFETRVQTQ